ncbi:MAG: hypothetical protein Q7T05_01430 [Dehalococcoidia bacterium]|nr:hypothetical protein [Dehalococcoidia bacterium]
MNTVLPLLSTIVTLIFAVTVFDQFLARRRSYQLVWAIGLALYLMGTAAEFTVGAYGVSSGAYRVRYLCGGLLTAAWLGMGTVYLLFPGKGAHVVMGVLVVASLAGVYQIVASPVDVSKIQTLPLSSEGFEKGIWGVRGLLIILTNTFGTITLAGGAVYSAVFFWRRGIYPHRILSNVLIAVGAMMPALGGTLIRAGIPSANYVLELVGVIVIFIGFLRNREVFGLYRFPLVHGLRRVS